MRPKLLLFYLLFLITLSSLLRVSFSQEYMNTICKRGITIYPNRTSCSDLIYVTREEIKGEEVQILSTGLVVIIILCLVVISALIYKKFLQR